MAADDVTIHVDFTLGGTLCQSLSASRLVTQPDVVSADEEAADFFQIHLFSPDQFLA
ncbi:hypothetical protein [Serratia odorifera]|uniref:hypothetical protein n=1 Tax=Serratia odorifera TaxID=618 RepID=UPI001F542301|nr:hypothetical protein [Serratia odorifera]